MNPRGRASAAPGVTAPGPVSRLAPIALTILAAVAGVLAAWHRAWVCDDAFISFRYAENLVRGRGLVFNPGEPVEGYTNFLWTIWVAFGMRLGVDPEPWSTLWGLAAYAGAIGLLGWRAVRPREAGAPLRAAVPVAALVAAFHGDWAIYATSGLETSLFTFLALLAFVLLTGPTRSAPRTAWAGLVCALAAMTRPEGVVLAAVAGVFVLARAPRGGPALVFGGAFLALFAPFMAWRLWTYGDWLPNTFYAKSGNLAWWSQGWIYARLYFSKYWVALAGLPLAAVAACFARPGRGWLEEAALAAAIALALTAVVTRVGGDFMYARLLIPATPFFLVLLELAIERLSGGRLAIQALAGAGSLAAMLATPHPLPGREEVSGIVNEWRHYPPEVCREIRDRGLALRPWLEGLPVCVAFVGSEARLVYYARPALAIESAAGLTDRTIAHLPLAARGRVGHEKKAPVDYLVGVRKADLLFHPQARGLLGLNGKIPYEPIQLGDVRGMILHWNPELLEQLRARGARFEDFPAQVDRVIASLPLLTDEQVRLDDELIRRFYFDHVPDPERERPFLERLGRLEPPAGP